MPVPLTGDANWTEAGRHGRPRLPTSGLAGPALRPANGVPPGSGPVLNRSTVLSLQRAVGNTAVVSVLQRAKAPADTESDEGTQRQGGRRGTADRSRRSQPSDCPRGTKPIDQGGLDRETVHKVKKGVGATPADWVGITPTGDIITNDGRGRAENQGHVTDHLRTELKIKVEIPGWIWALLGFAAMIALVLMLLSGVGPILAVAGGLGLVASALLRRKLRAAGVRDTDESIA